MYISSKRQNALLQWERNNLRRLRREHLIDPSIPEEPKDAHVMETAFGTQKAGDREVEGEMDKTKTWWKTERKREKNTSDSGFWNCLVPTLLIILHISLCGGGFFGEGCLSAAVTGITMTTCVSASFSERKDTRELVPALPVTQTRLTLRRPQKDTLYHCPDAV